MTARVNAIVQRVVCCIFFPFCEQTYSTIICPVAACVCICCRSAQRTIRVSNPICQTCLFVITIDVPSVACRCAERRKPTIISRRSRTISTIRTVVIQCNRIGLRCPTCIELWSRTGICPLTTTIGISRACNQRLICISYFSRTISTRVISRHIVTGLGWYR